MLNSENFIKAYLDRINFSKTLLVNRDTLFNLQEAHLLHVPFENLDIHYGKKIKLEPELIFEKVVLNQRGGFCYELNGLFHLLLKALGFDVKMISGRVHSKDGDYGNEYDHLAIIATIDQRQYLVDVGFGKFSLAPLEIKKGFLFDDPFGQFQFDDDQDGYLKISMLIGGKLSPQYLFKTTERSFSEFEGMCHYHQTSKYSPFPQKKMISIVSLDGRITLSDQQVKISRAENEEILIFNPEEFNSKLLQYFHIKI
ncbi:arylamine N-acetyltransferase family protein [Pedobacter gandavensis]|uniref:arylamine N-acetyltransferase family protein n=1 Tax=Pedobacter gandavensis TaxID=2679963 RepID=UPI002930B789|nr:arylamine N-acetyltransferase [Pedobacter gandavensis]